MRLIVNEERNIEPGALEHVGVAMQPQNPPDAGWSPNITREAEDEAAFAHQIGQVMVSAVMVGQVKPGGKTTRRKAGLGRKHGFNSTN